VQESLAFQVGVASSDRLALFLPIVRAVFLPREGTLSAFQSLAFIRKVRRLDDGSVAVVDVFQDTHVDANCVSHFIGLLGRVVRDFGAGDGVPLAGGLAFDRDGLDSGVVRQVTVECDGNVTNL